MHSNFISGSLDPLVALVGSPNSGKTSVFNWLTDLRFKTVNYPGATVECYLGHLARRFGSGLRIMDTPGVYSLVARTADEAVTMRALFDQDHLHQVSVVVIVVDATQLRRQLILVQQILKAGFRCVVALTMTDLLRKKSMSIDVAKLSALLGVPVVPVEGRLGGGIQDLVEATRQVPNIEVVDRAAVHVSTELDQQTFRGQSLRIADQVLENLGSEGDLLSETLWWDSVFLHRIFGPILFLVIMAALFSSVFYLAAPLMDGVDAICSFVSRILLASSRENIWLEFLASGVVPSFAAVFVFVPQIFILFIGIGLMEDSGYLARAATLIDRPFSKIGLSGRSFVPLLSGFACAVPAMMATRNITSLRERWIVLSVLPLMACSARLPIYAVLLSFLFMGANAWKAGVALAILYLASMLLGAFAASILSQILEKLPASKRHVSKSHFVMELPIYRRPQLWHILRNAFHRTRSYALRAGPVIFSVALILWMASSFPRNPDGTAPSLSRSYAAEAGHWIEPMFRPLGLDWRAGVGLLSAFSAREVFVSSLALVMNLSANNVEDVGLRESFLQRMKEATFDDGQKVFTTASVMGLVVYFMLALQCLSTTTMAAREWNSWRWAAIQLILFNVIAYGAALSVVQGLRALGIH